MPIYNTPLLTIDKSETRRYAGLRQADFPDNLLEQACAEAQLLATPKGCWEMYAYDDNSHTINSPTPFVVTGKSLASHLKGVTMAAVMAVTVGEALEAAITAHFKAGDYTAGLLLDAAGTTAVETVADQVNSFIAKYARQLGLFTVPRFSPGYGDWPITDQHQVLTLAGGYNIGITVTASSMLTPRKSVTAIIGLTPQDRNSQPICPDRSCASCSSTNCIARKERLHDTSL